MSVMRLPTSAVWEIVLILMMVDFIIAHVRMEQLQLAIAVKALLHVLVGNISAMAIHKKANYIFFFSAGCNVVGCQNGGVCTEANICDCSGTGFMGDLCQICKK